MVVMVWYLYLQLPVQSVPITTKVLRSIPTHGEVYSIQHYVIKCVSDLRQVVGFLCVRRFPPTIKLNAVNYSLLVYAGVTILYIVLFLCHWSVYFRRESFVFIFCFGQFTLRFLSVKKPFWFSEIYTFEFNSWNWNVSF